MTYLDRLPKGSRRPETAVVIRDAIAAARAAGQLDEVRAALVAVYGAALVEPELQPATKFVVQVWNGRRWAKVRGGEGGPWLRRDRAERIARSRELAERRESSTEGMPHRVVEVRA